MPYSSKDWKPAIYRGQTLTGIKKNRENNNKFLFDVSVKKLRRKKIIVLSGTESERHQAAIRFYSEFRADIYEGYFLDAVTFDEMFNRWLSLKQPTRWIRLQLGVYQNHIEKHIGVINMRDIQAKDIDRVMIAVKDKAPRTKKGIISIVKNVLTLALNEKIIKSLPLEPRHGVVVNAAEQKTLIVDAETKYQAVHNSIVTVFKDDPSFRAVFLFGLNGRRKTEILSLEWSDISFKSMTYIVRSSHSKIKQDLSFSIPGEIMEALEEIKPNNPKGLVFPNPNTGKAYTNIRQHIQMIRDHSGWHEFGFHRMRNLTASALFGSGVDASYLSSLLGHTSPETLKQYLTMQRKEACEIVEDAAKKLLNQRVNDAAV